MITTFYPPYNFGGDGIFVQRLSNELADRGHQVEVIHCVDSYRLLAGREPEASNDHHPGVLVHGLRSRFGPLSPLATQQTGLPVFKSAAIRQILAKGFDVIHFHNVSLVGGPKVLQYGQGIKLYTMHEYWLVCPTHTLFRFNRAPCAQRHCSLCELVYRRPPQWWRHSSLLRAAAKHVDAFLALCRFCQHKHQELGLEIPMVHLPGFVPHEHALVPDDAAAGGDAAREPYYLYVGRLTRLKGLHTLIPIFRRQPQTHLWVAGAGGDEAQLRRMAAGADNIRFLGHQGWQELRALYRRATALIVPSIWYEMFPQVILEAFSQRTPVIVTDRGGMPEMLQESGGGFIYRTEGELLEAMRQLMANPSLRDELGQKGYSALQREWTAEAHLRRYFRLIEKLASRRGGQAHSGDRPSGGALG
jgi:glycosyltransferase involved in cell wall biosynthesis